MFTLPKYNEINASSSQWMHRHPTKNDRIRVTGSWNLNKSNERFRKRQSSLFGESVGSWSRANVGIRVINKTSMHRRLTCLIFLRIERLYSIVLWWSGHPNTWCSHRSHPLSRTACIVHELMTRVSGECSVRIWCTMQRWAARVSLGKTGRAAYFFVCLLKKTVSLSVWYKDLKKELHIVLYNA